jgi:hypothetical protein
MQIRVDVYHHLTDVVPSLQHQLETIHTLLVQVLQRETQIMNELDALEVEAKANTDAEQAAVVLLGKLHDLLVAAGTDPVRIKAITDALGTSKDALAAAIVANTPAA